ncbi:RNA polymerase sigma factor [Amycolatopsis cihanbeyliensis]|uniref:RNA polymerase sigma-70 factor (ECF subfamily) n=1 Tax=Amycolatopsis cihanbeyliensis TaxID=1128664 RepID=A0A542DD62_AMYCI|nr:sigma-70 family RNA polymerase sigma factor [Amycolatopsis cihanbeyliensis]TQJ01014.1 RNA polymerase sigma-70 factor (ECF subfamily) [Amycolatopsis cihanbeyliensis]
MGADAEAEDSGTGRAGDRDVALLASAVRGNQAAFDSLVRRHTPRMYRVALRITGTSAEAEDVVQEAWISAWRGLSGFRSESAVSTWLYRVVTNTALAYIRRRRPTVSLDAALTPDDESRSLLESGLFADTRANPEGRVVRAEEVDAALRAIASLDVSQRVPLVLRELEGLSYEEVAEVLQVSVPALRSRLHRARVALLAKLREQ